MWFIGVEVEQETKVERATLQKLWPRDLGSFITVRWDLPSWICIVCRLGDLIASNNAAREEEMSLLRRPNDTELSPPSSPRHQVSLANTKNSTSVRPVGVNNGSMKSKIPPNNSQYDSNIESLIEKMKSGLEVQIVSFWLIFLWHCTKGEDLDCKTVRILAYSRTREQSNKRSGTRLKTERRVRLARFVRVRLLRHALPISLLILRKKNRLFCV